MWQRKQSPPSRIHVPSHIELLGGRVCPTGKYISKKFCICVTSVGQWQVQRNGVCFPGWSSQFSDMLPIFLPLGEKDLGPWGGKSPRNSCIRLKSSDRPCVCVPNCSVMSHSVTPWTVAYQSPLSMGFPRQEYWGVLPFPFPGGSSVPRDQTHASYVSLHCQVDSLPLSHLWSPSQRSSSLTALRFWDSFVILVGLLWPLEYIQCDQQELRDEAIRAKRKQG